MTTSKHFFKAWSETVINRKTRLLELWRQPKDYTTFVRGAPDSVLGEVADKLGLLCYENDYYCLDAVFYLPEDKTPGIKHNTYWFHDIRIGFEHENHFGSGLYKEVSHLLLINCDLRVLVTYPDNSQEKELEYLHEIISANRQAKSISENESFLIIFGYENGFEWRGMVYKTTHWEALDTI